MNIVIVEDHSDLRNGLQLIVNNADGLICSATFDRCETLISEITKGNCTPDAILLDIGLPGMSGTQGVKEIKAIHPDVIIIMMTVYEEDHHIFQAICSGAGGYLLKSSNPKEIIDAIHQADQGGVPMTPVIAQKVLTMFRDFAPQQPRSEINLTPREQDVLRALVDGLDYKQVAERYSISIDTVRNHIRKTYHKLEVHSKSEAVAKALKQRLV